MRRRLAALLVLAASLAPPASAETLDLSEPVVMRAAAVSETPEGLVGSTALITITAARGGSGHVFLDTFPLTEIDMQGSARLAARVAAQTTGLRLSEFDLFFVIRSGSQQIGGPSAGAALAVGAIAAMNGWKVRDDALMTGTINPDGSVGPVGGVPEKAAAAAQAGMRLFLFPQGQETVLRADGTRVFLASHCESQLRIECRAVSNVRDAVAALTDHEILAPVVEGDVTGGLFQERLGPLSEELVDRAERRVAEAQAAIARVPRAADRQALAATLEGVEAMLDDARQAAADGTSYTAASLSFQVSIDELEVAGLARLASGDAGVVDAMIADADDAVVDARRDVERFEVSDSSLFESAGAAQDRLMDAEGRLASARAAADLSEEARAVENAAWATERAATASWWLRLGENLPRGTPVDAATLEGAARDAITTSEEVVAYVEAVLRSVDAVDALADSKASLLRALAAAERGYLPGAMYLALDAEVRASALLEIVSYGDAIPETAFETKQVEAARAIQAARGRGHEPLLAQSVYEYSFAQQNPLQRLTYLGMARVTANLAGLPGLLGAPTPVETRFQGLPAITVPAAWVAAAFAVGLAMGAGIGLTALLPRDEEGEEPVPPQGAPPARTTISKPD